MININYSTYPSNVSTYSDRNTISNDQGSNLSKDTFLQLLVTQLENQDPLNPMDDKDFIAQMAQFSSLEQMQNINTNMSAVKAYSLLGKTVTGTINENGNIETINGKVDSIYVDNGNYYLKVNDLSVPIDSIVSVGD